MGNASGASSAGYFSPRSVNRDGGSLSPRHNGLCLQGGYGPVTAAGPGQWATGGGDQGTWDNLAGRLLFGHFRIGLGFSGYYSGLRQIGPARAGVFINLVPVFAIVQAALLLQNQPSPTLLLEGALVIAGVTLTNRLS